MKRVLNRCINLITELGYREWKAWGPDEDELLHKLTKLAEEHTKNILEAIEEDKLRNK